MSKKKGKSKSNGGDRSKNGPTSKRPNTNKPIYPSDDKNRIKITPLSNDLQSACNQILKDYPYVICCIAGEIVHTHGCFEHELQDEYHWVCEQVYSKIFSTNYVLTNSSHPSNKVCPQEAIMKSIAISKKKKKNYATFGGGQYDSMAIIYAPFDVNNDGVIKMAEPGESRSGCRGQDLVKRKRPQKREEGEVIYYERNRCYYQKVNGKLKYLGTKLQTA